MNPRQDQGDGVPSHLPILKMDANDNQMPPIGSVRVNYTTPECSEDSTSTRPGAEDTNNSNFINTAPITKLEKLFHPSNVSPIRLGLAEGQEAVKVSDRLVHVKDI
jgi:hypothetical protein